MTSADFADLMFTSVYETKGLGVTHVNINQRFRDMEVFGGHVTVNVDADGKRHLRRRPAVQPGDRSRRTRRTSTPTAAVAKAALGLKLDAPEKAARRCAAPAPSRRRPSLSGGGISRAPIEATLGWQPTAQRPQARLAHA